MEKTLSEIKFSSEKSLSEHQRHSLGVLGVSFKTAQIKTREQLAKSITLDRISDLVKNTPLLESCELVLLSTCNRVEIYYYGSEALVVDPLRKLLEEECSDKSEVYHIRTNRAAAHLFAVTAGLDSLVIGEAQILAQVKEASKLCAENGLAGEVMSRLFSKAYETARTVREQNPNFANTTNYSVSHAVLELIRRECGNKKPNLMLIGSGKMIRLAISSLDSWSLGKVVVAARKKAIENIKPDSIIGIADIARTIVEKKIDVVITATSSEDYILRAEDFKDDPSPLLILDISVPRNIDPKVGNLRNVTLLNLDDMKDKIGNSVEAETSLKVSEELSRGVTEFSVWLEDYKEIAPLLSSLRKRAETIREEELANTLARLPNLTDSQKATIEKMSERLITRFLHDPTVKLKSLSRTESHQKAKIYAEVISELFSSRSVKTTGE